MAFARRADLSRLHTPGATGTGENAMPQSRLTQRRVGALKPRQTSLDPCNSDYPGSWCPYPAFGPQVLLSAQPDRRPENLAHARQSLGQRHGLDPPSGREVDRGFRVEHVASLDNALRNVLFARQATCQADSAATPPGNKSRRLVAAGRTEAGHVARSANFRASSTGNTTQTLDLHSSPVSTLEFSAFPPITIGTSRQHSHAETHR